MLDRDRQMLTFEEEWSGRTSAKDEAVAVRLDLSPARFQQRLLGLIHDHDAEAAFSQLIRWLRRTELARADDRAARASARRAGR